MVFLLERSLGDCKGMKQSSFYDISIDTLKNYSMLNEWVLFMGRPLWEQFSPKRLEVVTSTHPLKRI